MAKIIALDPQATFTYILKSQRDDEEGDQVVWELKHLSAKEEAFLEDKLGHVRDGDFHVKIGSQNRLALDIGLVSVSNFLDASGNDVRVERSSVKMHGFVKPLKDEFVDRIPKEVRAELSQVILNGSSLDEDDIKN